ncbi:hypothetical protein IT570_11395 [Candidatus Sumerlaeota bacterium]|nr:hypothetical protein [Candidatus Sumerlaeota bacterium]
MTHPTLIAFCATLPAALFAQLNDANSLYGVHWYATTDNAQVGSVQPATTDAEMMAPGRELWVLEINHVDDNSPTGQSDVWSRPDYFNAYDLTNGTNGYSRAVTVGPTGTSIGSGKNHSLVYRLQPNWGRNVPHASDPYTVSDFANDCAGAANWNRKFCRFWQIGNEVNIVGENTHWNGSSYATSWDPTPEQYADTYLACRDAIHTVTPEFATGFQNQVVLMQPVSPGNASPGVRSFDGNEFLYRQIRRMIDTGNSAKLDGFALHSYAEPGGSNFGTDGFMDGLREQLMVIDELGFANKPVLITEFNKHMPDAPNAAIGARFVQASYAALNSWNVGSGGAWPGQPNHDIMGACWFIFLNDTGTWKDYSLQYQKAFIGGTDPNTNPWYGFQAAAAQNYPAGSITGGGATPDQNALWWQDDFNSIDTTPSLPDWLPETSAGANITANAGKARFVGSSGTPSATLRTAGYVYGNFRAEFTVTIVNNAQVNSGAGEANFDVRFREGSMGYSLTVFTDASDASRKNRIQLRRVNNWGENIGGVNTLLPNPIVNGDTFRTIIVANGTNLTMTVYKTSGLGASNSTPVLNQSVVDGGQNVGWLRLGTYNLAEAQFDQFALGGKDWTGLPANVNDWSLF